jgi:curli biogenesis system outer membrane secretion channel CsgG
MKITILLIPFFIISCATSDIAVDREAMKSIKTVAIAPFTSADELKKGILTEAEGNFRSALIKLNYKIVEREKLNALLKEKELSMAGVTTENARSIGAMLGADAILIGEIISYDESQREVQDFQSKKIEIKTFYKFQIIVRLVDVSTGAIILTIKNASPEAMQSKELSGYSSLDSYRILVLNQMESELVDAMKKKN